MASNLDKFLRSTVGSSGRISDYDQMLSSRGDFMRLEDLNVILASWNNILFTSKGTVDHDPEFGVDIYKYLFEPYDDFLVDEVKDEIATALMRYENRATIQNISVSQIQGDRKGFSITISFKFNGEVSSLSVGLDQNTYLKGTE